MGKSNPIKPIRILVPDFTNSKNILEKLQSNDPRVKFRALEYANQYRDASLQLHKNPDSKRTLIPMLVICAFACELYLKSLLHHFGLHDKATDRTHGHELEFLFNNIPDNGLKQKIAEKFLSHQNQNETKHKQWILQNYLRIPLQHLNTIAISMSMLTIGRVQNFCQILWPRYLMKHK